VLKQRVRDCIAPSRDLGHSDVGGKNSKAVSGDTTNTTSITEEVSSISGTAIAASNEDGAIADRSVGQGEAQTVAGEVQQGSASSDLEKTIVECEDCK
jgi:hypothetical protein